MGEPIAITGWALASPFGQDEQAFWQGVLGGPTPAVDWTPEPDFPGLGMMDIGCRAARLPDAPPIGRGGAGGRMLAVTTDVAKRALAMAGISELPAGSGMALGSCFAEADHYARPKFPPAPPLLPTLARELGLTGPLVNMPVNCTAGNLALIFAVARLRAGEAPLMLAGGLDVMGPINVGSFVLLDNITKDLPRPFDVDRDGFLMSEGGALFVLETVASAEAAGRPIYALLTGVGRGHDASHPVRPSPEGRGLVRAMRSALADAGLDAGAIGYVNAHSPGTAINDPSEAAALGTIFGAQGVPVSSTKGAHGHALGGANALEAMVCLLALRERLLPPTLNLVTPAEGLALDLIQGAPRATDAGRMLSLAASMGGATSALILERGASTRGVAAAPVARPSVGVKLVVAGVRSDEPEVPGLRYASVNGRQLISMIRSWEPMNDREPVTACYQALGLEKRQAFADVMAIIERYDGFDGFKPASVIFEHSPIGPFVQLAVEAGALGPFASLEGDALAGGIALVSALEDLTAGLADRALVGGFRFTVPRAWLALLAVEPGRTTRWKAIYTHGRPAPDASDLAIVEAALGAPATRVPVDPVADPLGLAAHAALMEACEAGGAHFVFSHAADGRGLLVAVRHG